MTRSIRLHSKYGVNPTIPQCFWCGQDKNEVALLGAAYKGEAPMHMVLDHEPCETCKQKFAQGILFFEVDDEPTGRWVVIKRDSELLRAIAEPLRTHLLAMGKCRVRPEDWVALGFPYDK